MSENTAYVVDKSEWPRGPWDDEPDKLQWQHAGYACLLLRGPAGAWCGYCGIPEDHPDFGKAYSDVDNNYGSHYGLTYADECYGNICHVPEPGMPDKVWWFGWDAAHYEDLCPAYMNMFSGRLRLGETYRDIAYAKQTTEKLAEELRAAHQPAIASAATEASASS